MPENASKRYINMAKITMNELSAELTAEELRELEDAEKKDPVLDEESPSMTMEQLMQFKRIKEDEEESNEHDNRFFG
jgi:hypothetical protein